MKPEKIAEIEKYICQIDEYVPALLAREISQKFGVTYKQAMDIINKPYNHKNIPTDECCHYCGMPAKSTTFFGVPACKECGG